MSQNARKHAIATSVVAVCILVIVPLSAQVPAQTPQSVVTPVQVVNTPNVTVANTPAVTLQPGASVNVTNPPDNQGNPIPLATLEAIQVYGSNCGFLFLGSDEGGCAFSAIPDGKQLVVQEFDAGGSLEAGNRPILLALNNTITQSNYFPYTFMASSGGFDYLATHQETRLYVAPGMTPACDVHLAQTSNSGAYRCDISGFLVDVPSGQEGITSPHQKARLPLFYHAPAR